MAQFKDLPNEIIIMIAESVLPGDIENFSATAKNIRRLSKPALRKHYELRRRYKKYSRIMKEGHLSDLMHDIDVQPEVGRHVEYLTLQSDLNNDPVISFLYPCEKMMSLRRVVAHHVPADQNSAWVRAIESGGEDPVLALLLLQLSNVTLLELNYVMATYRHVFQTLIRILETPGVPYLSNLTTLEINRQDSDVDNNEHWHAINIFAKLPSLRSITARNFCIKDDENDSDYLLHPRTSNVSSLRFRFISISAQRLYEFLRGFKNLKHFSYKNTHEAQHSLETFWMRAALETYARASLEYLSLRREWADEKRYMGSLRDFENLKRVSTDFEFLFDRPRSGRVVLAQMLPASIEEVHLYEDRYDDPESFEDMIASTAEDRPKLLPRLK